MASTINDDELLRQFELRLYDQRCATGAAQHCNLCRDIAQLRFPFTITADLGRFQASSRQCMVCSAIYDGMTELQSCLQTQWNSMTFRFNACSDSPRFYASEVIPKDGTCQSKQFQMFTELGKVSPEPVMGAARSIAKESNSKECFDLLRHWILECEKHPACSALESAVPPTRLLDLQARDGFLVLHITRGETEPYIALSHCWGPNGLPDAAKTKRTTLVERMKGIWIESLPKSFQDAVTICRELGVRFLWIDSLCIIQGDVEDWDMECSRMQDVYRNSYLTISVARSSDSSNGCFSTRPSQHLSTKVGSINHQGQFYDLFCRESINHYDIASSDSFSESFPLFSRAWTLQERLLPRRVVHYAEKELIWECNTTCDCECAASQELLARWDLQKSTKQLFSDMMNHARHGPGFRLNWAILMRRFSLMKLSFDADRLPSVSGLVQALECEDTGRYLAGLWERELPWMIGWMSMGRGGYRPSAKPTPPSWSWTSIENAWVAWNYSTDLGKHGKWMTVWHKGGDSSVRHNEFKIVQCVVQSVNCTPLRKHDTLGQVSSGTLILTGRLTLAVLQEDYFCERNAVRQRYIPDAPLTPGIYDVGQSVYCFMIGAINEERPKYPGLIAVSSLILRRRKQLCGEEGKYTYERIGIMSQNNHFAWDETPIWWKEAKEAMVEIT